MIEREWIQPIRVGIQAACWEEILYSEGCEALAKDAQRSVDASSTEVHEARQEGALGRLSWQVATSHIHTDLKSPPRLGNEYNLINLNSCNVHLSCMQFTLLQSSIISKQECSNIYPTVFSFIRKFLPYLSNVIFSFPHC